MYGVEWGKNPRLYQRFTYHYWKPEAKPLIERLNIFAARERNWLPPNYGKTKYEDMTDEEKDVVDSFQGRAAYEMVCNNPSQYILSDSNISMKLLA